MATEEVLGALKEVQVGFYDILGILLGGWTGFGVTY